ncbi:MAG: hypothetical protein LBC67_04255 [Spirochaetales bacterium]|jgi:hypothetical protein|nr:hypothetical protein [Spirochaetales bacterium]
MENIDTVYQNQHLLLTLLMDSMLKVPEITAQAAAGENPAGETAPHAADSPGEQLDILA